MTTPLSNADDTAEYIKLRTTKDPIEAFNLFIKRNVDPSLHAHFDDCDDNEAEYVRRTITTYAEQFAAERVMTIARKLRPNANWSANKVGSVTRKWHSHGYTTALDDLLSELQTPKPQGENHEHTTMQTTRS